MIKSWRRKIEAIDQQIVRLLDRRAKAAKAIAKVKAREGLPYHVPERERQVLNRVKGWSEGDFPRSGLEAVYREIISGSLSLEKPLAVAYFGQRATFTHLAAISRFGSSAEYIPLTIREIFTEVEKGNADYGVVPVENSTEGVITHTLDMFMDTGLVISGEILMEIHHCLLSHQRSLGAIKRLYCNAQPLAQCRKYVRTHLKGRKIIEVSSTAEAAKLAARKKDSAAIGAKLAAQEYGLRVVAQNIEDARHNITRFLVLGKNSSARSGRDRTSIMFLVKDRVGALISAIEPLKKYRVNMTSIESRPSRKRPWEYYFFIDIEGHASDVKLEKAIKELKRHCLMVKVLGSYARGD